MGGPLVLQESTGGAFNIGRYGVWDNHSGSFEVIACGDDLEVLQAEFGPGLDVLPIGVVPD